MSAPLGELWDAHVLPWLVERACRSHEILEERRRVIPRASGQVLELGVGSGLNLGLYDAAKVVGLVGLDPSEPLLARARARLAQAKVPVELVRGVAERLPFDAGRFDCVVVTYTLCSVEAPALALGELGRVLRPGGLVLFIEHGLAPGPAEARWQRRITPLWRRVGGNCHLDRDVVRSFESAGFALPELRAAYAEGSPRWLSFTYEGVATRG
jgi:ubiquinone/menaquinone biosynthesis C-methylase UbiE